MWATSNKSKANHRLLVGLVFFFASWNQKRHQRTCFFLDLTQHAEKSRLHSVAVQGMFSEMKGERVSECQQETQRRCQGLQRTGSCFSNSRLAYKIKKYICKSWWYISFKCHIHSSLGASCHRNTQAFKFRILQSLYEPQATSVLPKEYFMRGQEAQSSVSKLLYNLIMESREKGEKHQRFL